MAHAGTSELAVAPAAMISMCRRELLSRMYPPLVLQLECCIDEKFHDAVAICNPYESSLAMKLKHWRGVRT